MTVALPDAGARRRIVEDLDATLFVEAGAGSGKTRTLVDRAVRLVTSGRVELRHVAAVTFTEKAAAELRDRLRQAFAARPDDPRCRTALAQLDAAAIGTLHAFAQRLLTERPIEARLPPDVQVLDEVASEVAAEERWRRLRTRLLEEPGLERSVLLALAAGIQLDHLWAVAAAFDANWDLLADPATMPWGPGEPPALDLGSFLAELDAVTALRHDCCADDDRLLARLDQLAAHAAQLRAAPDEYEQVALLGADTPSFAGGVGRAASWPGTELRALRARIAALGERRRELRDEVARAAVRQLALVVREAVLEAARERRAAGRLAFHDLLVLARELLRGPDGPAVRADLRHRYRRLLLDEFQDTDPIQVEIAVLLASDDPEAGGRPWSAVATEPGRLFFVGDPKQSIYRFRRANIALFLAARDAFAGDPVRLTTNFRSTRPVLAWLNHVFGALIRPEEGSQPEYVPLAAAREAAPVGPPVLLLGADPADDDPTADQLRDREAADVADAVLTAVADGWSVRDGTEGWRPARLGDVAVLLPARTSLPALEQALEERGLPYRAETTSLVYATPEVRDLFAALRAVADPTDALALVTALRSPLFGCGDDDLATWKLRHGGAWHLYAPVPDDAAGHPVAEAVAVLRDLADQARWLAPSELLDRLCRDRRLFELGFADGRPRDLWRRLRFVVDQARAWSEAEGGTLREYLAWATLQASESTRVAETVLPETDDDAVRILTVHGAKGLQFPITVLSGTTSRAGGRSSPVQVVFPPGEAVGLKVGRAVSTPEYEAFKPIDEQLDHHERLRLLYVACTRAEDHLVVSLHRKARRTSQSDERKLTSAELLAGPGLDAPSAALFHAGDPARRLPSPRRDDLRPPAPPPLDVWRAELDAALDRSRRPRTVAATAVAAVAATAAAGAGAPAADPGLAKQPRDLDLPPWQKGRYGTAIGRAVHAVLQTVDLASGAGLDAAVAAQAAAEGVTGREPEVAALACAALDAPAVRESLRWPRWRETYVAAPVGDTTVEGYVDLLYRTDDGLVVVDYKTAGARVDLTARAAGYRLQAAAYALALATAVGERVARCVFVFLTPDGAVEHRVDDLDAAVDEVRERLTDPAAPPLGPLPDPGDPAPA